MISRDKVKRDARDRLKPVENLTQDPSPEARIVLHDWMREQSHKAAHDLWTLSTPPISQRDSTLLIIGPGTTPQHVYPYDLTRQFFNAGNRYRYSRGHYRGFEVGYRPTLIRAAIYEAEGQFEIHKHAQWIRLPFQDVQTTPRGNEILMTFERVEDRSSGSVIELRSRSRIPECLQDSRARLSEIKFIEP